MQLWMLGGSVIDDSAEQASDTVIEAFLLAPLKFKNQGAGHETSGETGWTRFSPGSDSENLIDLKHVLNSLQLQQSQINCRQLET